MRESLLEPLLRHLRIRRVLPYILPDSVLLDIGCGTKALFLKTISNRLKNGFGVDFKVKSFSDHNISVSQFRFDEKLPFQDCSFDVVTMLAVLEHIENKQGILQEIPRVLVPGGRLILTVPSVWARPILEFLSYRLKIVSEGEIRDHKRYYNKDKLLRVLIHEAGFKSFHHQYFQLWMNNFCTVRKD